MKQDPFELTPEFFRQILGHDTKEKIKLSKERTIATLWAGYGTVSRLTVSSSSSNHHGNCKQILVIKRVLPPKEKDGLDSIGNQRKLKSYRVEASFYQEIAPIIFRIRGGEEEGRRNANGIAAPVWFPTIAKPYSIQALEEEEKEGIDGSGGVGSSSFCFILSDLSERYSQSYRSDNIGQVKAAIKWLAAFHSIFYRPTTMASNIVVPWSKMWSEGGYWHLKTRLEELHQIPGSHKIFQSSAFAIDERMNDGPPSCFTLVHGDFKDANVLFGKDNFGNWICSAVDFQYCGRGYGAKDLVMFVVSSVSAKVLDEFSEDGLLSMYAEELKENVVSLGHLTLQEIDNIVDCKVLKMQYELALVDYVRFMAG